MSRIRRLSRSPKVAIQLNFGSFHRSFLPGTSGQTIIFVAHPLMFSITSHIIKSVFFGYVSDIYLYGAFTKHWLGLMTGITMFKNLPTVAGGGISTNQSCSDFLLTEKQKHGRRVGLVTIITAAITAGVNRPLELFSLTVLQKTQCWNEESLCARRNPSPFNSKQLHFLRFRKTPVTYWWSR